MKEKKIVVAVGSTNPTKVDPVAEIFRHHFPNCLVKGVKVSSDVAEQPLSDTEMYQGAYNRAQNALKKIPKADFGVGIEGGMHEYPYGWFERSTIVIMDRAGNVGIGTSGGLVLPDKIIAGIKQGKNLEQAVDELFGTQQIGEGIGMFGIMTKGVVTRAEGVKHGVAFALARFLHEGLY